MLAVLVVLLAVLAAYVQALGGPFLWDDRVLILDAPRVQGELSLLDHLRKPFWSGTAQQAEMVSYYRPLVTGSFALDHALHGNNPGGYHLTNVVFHVANACLLLAVLRRAGIRDSTAALFVVGWAWLPRLAEAAAWISGRTELLMTSFALGALLAWERSLPRRLLAAGSFTFALLAKESAVAVVIGIAAMEWVERRELPPKARLLEAGRRLLPLLVVLGSYAALRLFVIGVRDETTSIGFIRRVATVFQSLGTYAGMLLDAWRPRAVIGRVGAVSIPAVLAGIALLSGCVVLWVRARGRISAPVALGLGLAAGALLPVLHIVPIPLRTLAADRFLYLPAAGLILAAAPGVDRWLGGQRRRWVLAGALVASLGVTGARRVAIWSDEVEFWVRTYLETPNTNHAAAIELFGLYYRGQLFADALALSERALTYDDPRKADASYNAALALARLGRREEALARLERSAGRGRPRADVMLERGILLLQLGRDAEARAVLEPLARRGEPGARWVLSRSPELVRAREELARVGSDTRRPELVARLASLLGLDEVALDAWTRVALSPVSDKALVREALLYLVHAGDRASLARAALAHEARFGALDAELAGMVEVRLTELERLIAARPRLGLPNAPSVNAPR